ncbi:alpha-L-fucosidase [Flavivirga jejuensis]|uniref:alpha-L-fucosidase n=1 Tax=Flavivirga jejuensis TaxID=870487 RepID=A0ABT8WL04_9FLAO|nr:alpha-L-fucosidase [Flavivirga jejuensis]MDO5973836.1 alpha-L-fucosidase [Flavivirga jejuensis]
MCKFKFFMTSFLFVLTIICFGQKKEKLIGYKEIDPNWESMAENYQVPEWFQDGKIGVWMHWGIPSSIDENRPHDGSHYGRRMYGPLDRDNAAQAKMNRELVDWHVKTYGAVEGFGYEKFVPGFKAEKWNPEGLVKFFKDCGANFIMPVATHHDNFDLYDSFFSWNSVDMGPKRDVIQEWKDAAIKYNLKFGVSTHLYWSPRFFRTARKYQKPNTLEWELFNMDYDDRKFSSQKSWNEHWYKRCWELIEKYDPDMFNNDSPYPTIKMGDGLGVKLFSDFLNKDLKENNGKQTTVLSFKNAKQNKAAFTYNLERGMFGESQNHPWMWATDLSGSWFYRKQSKTKMSVPVLIGNAVDAISKNGVVMMNVALKGDGSLPKFQANMLTSFGNWIKINGEGIYGTRPWKIYGEGPLEIVTKRTGENLKNYSAKDIRFTAKEGNLYAFVLAPPTEDILIKTLKKEGILQRNIERIELLGSKQKINWNQNEEGLTIKYDFENKLNQPAICFRIVVKERN